jgi:hypothetical protein
VASGYDNLPVSLIKESIDLIAKPLAHIVNLSISSGIFPEFLNIARVINLYLNQAIVDLCQTTDQFQSFQFSLRSLKELFTIV